MPPIVAPLGAPRMIDRQRVEDGAVPAREIPHRRRRRDVLPRGRRLGRQVRKINPPQALEAAPPAEDLLELPGIGKLAAALALGAARRDLPIALAPGG